MNEYQILLARAAVKELEALPSKFAIRCSCKKMTPELIEVCPAAEEDDAVSRLEGLIAAGRELDAAIGPFDGDDNHAGQPADVGVAQRLAGESALGSDRH